MSDLAREAAQDRHYNKSALSQFQCRRGRCARGTILKWGDVTVRAMGMGGVSLLHAVAPGGFHVLHGTALHSCTDG